MLKRIVNVGAILVEIYLVIIINWICNSLNKLSVGLTSWNVENVTNQSLIIISLLVIFANKVWKLLTWLARKSWIFNQRKFVGENEKLLQIIWLDLTDHFYYRVRHDL